MKFFKYTPGNGKIGLVSALVGYVFVLAITAIISPTIEEQIPVPSISYTIARTTELCLFLVFLSICALPKKIPLKNIWITSERVNFNGSFRLLIIKLLALALIIEILIQIYTGIYSNTINPQKFTKEIADLTSGLNFPPNSYEFFLGKQSIISHCIVTSIVEEFVFRGIFLNILLIRFRPTFAIILSSLMFALLHSSHFSAFLGGLFLGWTYVTYGRLSFCIALHGFGNFLLITFYSFGGGQIILYIAESNVLATGVILFTILAGLKLRTQIRDIIPQKTPSVFRLADTN